MLFGSLLSRLSGIYHVKLTLNGSRVGKGTFSVQVSFDDDDVSKSISKSFFQIHECELFPHFWHVCCRKYKIRVCGGDVLAARAPDLDEGLTTE